MNVVYIVAAKRTAIGTFGGSLRQSDPAALGAAVIRSALQAVTINPDAVGHVVFGQVIPTSPRDAYIARVAAMEAGIPKEVPAMTTNRLCGSGLQAIISAAHTLLLGDAEIAVGGGAEVMSKAPYFSPALRWGQRMGDAVLVDGLQGALTDPFGMGLMGVTAENVAQRYNINRDRQDALALQSQQRANTAIAAGYFNEQIVPIKLSTKGVTTLFHEDENVRRNISLQDLSKLPTIFRKEGGTVTAGNSSGINDAAAAVVLATEQAVKLHNLKPLARLVSYGHAGVDPAYMGIGPVQASRIALNRAGLEVKDLGVVESNEAFAAQACAVADEMRFDPERTNPNGSGISLGHPVGATGAIIITKLVHELERTGERFGLATMCIGGGQGIAAILEHV